MIIGDLLLLAGVLSSIVYVTADILCGLRYPGYSFTDQVINQLPTPWVGTVERIHLYAFFLWVGVLAVALLRRQGRNAADRK